MWRLDDLTVPVVAAPMAGGPSTPALVGAVAGVGGLGFLAAGYQSAQALAAQVRETRAAGAEVFGVNVFVPDREGMDAQAVAGYRDRLQPLADRFEVGTLPQPRFDDHDWEAKISLLLDDPVPVVSFTFGLPGREIVAALHDVDVHVVGTVTNVADARAARDCGVDSLCVQGPEAGGHRATFATTAPAGDTPLSELLAGVRAEVDLPVIAAGGLTTPSSIRSALRDAAAVQLGTFYLRSDEAGANDTHRQALGDPRFTETVVTRAFSGRLARALRNRFTDELGAHAPATYPAVNQVTSPIRKAAARAGDADYTHLWAGVGWPDAPQGPAADITRDLWDGVLSQPQPR